MKDESNMQYEVVPLELVDYDSAISLVGRSSKFIQHSDSVTDVTAYKVEGYSNYDLLVEASKTCRGGFGLTERSKGDSPFAPGEQAEKVERANLAKPKTPAARGKILAYVFGEQGWDDKPYDRAGGLYGSEGMEHIIQKTDGSPVWFLTGFVFSGAIPVVALQHFARYFEEWRPSYNICMILPPELAEGMQTNRKYVRYTGEGSSKRNRSSGYSGEVLIYCECKKNILNNCGIISDFQNMSELEDTLVNSAGRSGLTPTRRQRAFEMGATPGSSIRARLLDIGLDRSKVQENLCLRHGFTKEAVNSLCHVYGITMEQMVEYGSRYLRELITRNGVMTDIVDYQEYAQFGLGDAYIRALAGKFHASYNYLKSELEQTAGTAEDIRRTIQYCRESGQAGRNPSEADKHQNRAQLGWMGQHGDNDDIEPEVLEACRKNGISDYLAIMAWKINFNYYRYLGRLKWLEKQASGMGVTVRQWFGACLIDGQRVLRALQYDIDCDAAKRKIRIASRDLGGGVTVYDMCRDEGITITEFIQAYYNVGGVDIPEYTRRRCIYIKNQLPKLSEPNKAAHAAMFPRGKSKAAVLAAAYEAAKQSSKPKSGGDNDGEGGDNTETSGLTGSQSGYSGPDTPGIRELQNAIDCASVSQCLGRVGACAAQ